ncbi:secreted antigen 1 [Babesia divergens]|uniref:Secreted antigen 1 n=1 Tax=Babesia divergens TaxID=32595 RepID=A0AAD9LJ89_BABDI|nr:secreted antigen 1 [Babesia divergens]
MKFLGILRASALFILLSAFHGQPVSCGILHKILSSKKSSSDKVSENSEGDLAAQVEMLQEKLQALEAGLDKEPEESSTDNMAESTVQSPLVEKPKDSPVESQAIEKPSQEPSESSAPVAKPDLVFENSEWDDSMLASAVLFINEFCEGVKAEKFKEHIPNDIYEDLSKKCRNVSSYVGSFIHRFKPTYGPGAVDERKEIDQDFYKNVLKPEEFEMYVKWLVKNIPEIRVSFRRMSFESFKLSEEQLNEFSSYGTP